LKRTAVILTVITPFALALALPSSSQDAGPSYAKDVERVVVKRCAGCHEADKPKAELVLEKGVGYHNLTTRHSIQVPKMPLVDPGNPDGSYMWKKLTHTASQGKGMPRTLFGSKKLKKKELALIRTWIEGGALP